MDKSKITVGGTPFLTLLAILFIGLKLCDKIDWSWWWVLSPLWLPTAIVLGGFIVVYVAVWTAAWVIAAYKHLTRKWRND